MMHRLPCISFAFLTLVAGFLLSEPAFAQTPLQSGVTLRDLTGAASSETFFKIAVPPGQRLLVIQTSRGTGDCDLYVKFGAPPTTSDYDYRPLQRGNNELASITNPAAGDWHIMLRGDSAYSRLRLVATFVAASGATAAPTFNPPAGTFVNPVSVTIASATRKAVIRFTTDGTDPTSSSPLYQSPVRLTANTELRARAAAAGLLDSAVSTATYVVSLPTITTLLNNAPVTNLSGATASETFFKITVAPGQSQLSIQISGGTGDADLYVKRGTLPSLTSYDSRPFLSGNNEQANIVNPAAGDWFIMLRGRTGYSGVTLVGNYSLNGVDLIVWPASLEPFTITETFSATSCDVQEGLVQSGTRRLLRFGTETRNIGTSNLVLGAPENNPLFQYAPCHGHYHFDGFASYRLLDGNGQPVAIGHKVGFCLEDVSRWNTAANRRSVYDCGFQGIQAGWGDIYDAGLPGQWVDITDVQPGTYTLEVTMDPDNHIIESDETNNVARMQVTIGEVVPPVITPVQNNVPVSNISGPTGSQAFYRISVPASVSQLTVHINGGSGDCDLYVKRGSVPSRSDYDFQSDSSSNNETVTVSAPAADDWFIMLYGYRSYSGVTLNASY